MKKALLLFLALAITSALHAQTNPKILNINMNGSLRYQLRTDEIDSMYFTNMPVMLLSSPATGDTGFASTTELAWQAFQGATSYTLQVSSDSTFGTFAYNQSGLTATRQAVSGLICPTKYYWRVQANLLYNSTWSEVWNFTTTAWGPFNCGTSLLRYADKYYRTVKVGTQCWLKDNLDVGTMLSGSQTPGNNGTIEKYCHSNSAANCATYGGLYTWDEAMQYNYVSGAQGICPPGWRLPTSTELQTLASTAGGGNALKEIGQGSGSGAGTNTSGFSTMLGGWRRDYDGFQAIGTYANFWSATEYNATSSYFLQISGTSNYAGLGSYNKTYGYSVRCIKN